MIRSVLLALVMFGLIAMTMQDAPRVLFDLQHADEFVPADDLELTDAKCRTWNLAMFDHCTIKFESRTGDWAGQLDDWKFGRAPTGPIQLMEWQEDSSIVTTDRSLESVGNRFAFILAAVLMGFFLLTRLVVRITRAFGPRY